MGNTSIRFHRAIIVVVAAIMTLAVDARAENADDAARYRSCMELIAKNAEAAFDEAVAWQGLGGGAASEHCAGAALMALGYHRQAAERLETLAQRPMLEGPLKAGLLQQSAQGWLLANEPERAYAVLTAAIDINPNNTDVWIDRGAVLAEMTLYDEAIEDLSRALTLSPANADAWAFRGSAFRYLDRLPEAMRDLDEAIRLAPNHVEAYLERGNVRRLLGDNAGARVDWLRVIELEPEAEAADAARANIARMDVKVDQAGEAE